jgi:PIN domain nuclease of toxin-antitoxin system
VSPISLLEIQLLAETRRIELRTPKFLQSLERDSRFVIDEAPFATVVQRSLDLSWTRDPFDRLIVAHSLTRRVPLCSVDLTILENHKLLVPELR